MSLIGESDLDWIGEVLDVIEHHTGKSWRLVNELLDTMPVSRRRMNAVRTAVARLASTPRDLGRIARRTRELLLGAPAIDAADRRSRLDQASQVLGIDANELPALLFCDMKGERAIALPNGRLSELEVAAFANIALVQKAVRYAHRITICSWDDDGSLHRAANARGLLVHASRVANDNAAQLEIVGPLGLFRHTAVYGRMLGELVPLISGSPRFTLAIEQRTSTLEVRSPVLLPRAVIDHRAVARPAKLARQLEAIARDRRESIQVIVGPPPLVGDSVIVCPDLAIDVAERRWYIELIGYWTREFLEAKLQAYAEVGAQHVLLCVDTSRMVSAELELAKLPPGHVIQYARSLHAESIYHQVVRP